MQQVSKRAFHPGEEQRRRHGDQHIRNDGRARQRHDAPHAAEYGLNRGLAEQVAHRLLAQHQIRVRPCQIAAAFFCQRIERRQSGQIQTDAEEHRQRRDEKARRQTAGAVAPLRRPDEDGVHVPLLPVAAKARRAAQRGDDRQDVQQAVEVVHRAKQVRRRNRVVSARHCGREQLHFMKGTEQVQQRRQPHAQREGPGRQRAGGFHAQIAKPSTHQSITCPAICSPVNALK